MGNSEETSHHYRREYCTTRLKYRQGRQLKAVKVYTIADESQHLLVFGVPRVNLEQELKRTFKRYGQILFVERVTDKIASKMELELFTDVFHINFSNIVHSRRAKRFMDAKQFYGGILHVSYGPEYESLNEIRQKLKRRKQEISYRIRTNT